MCEDTRTKKATEGARDDEAVVAAGATWKSGTYSWVDGTLQKYTNPSIRETNLDYKNTRELAPTFDRIAAETCLAEALAAALGQTPPFQQELRLQVNDGGCYGLHTDADLVRGSSDGQQ